MSFMMLMQVQERDPTQSILKVLNNHGKCLEVGLSLLIVYTSFMSSECDNGNIVFTPLSSQSKFNLTE